MAIKERLARIPVIGPTWRAYSRYGDRQGNRLSAAVTYYGFLSLFPLITLAAAVVAATLDASQVERMQNKISEQVPGIADKLDLDALVRNAGAVGLIGGVLLLISGTGWVDATRSSIRTIWDRDEDPGNAIVRKVADVGVLIGLGFALALSVGASAFATIVIRQISDSIGLDDRPAGRILLQIVAFAVAVGASLVLFLYLLVGMPRLTMNRGVAVKGALIGAIGFELLKLLVSGYIAGVAGKSAYGAFGVPVALLLWIYFVVRLLLFCAAWTANAQEAADREAAAAEQAPTEPNPTPPTKPTHPMRTYSLTIAGAATLAILLERFTRDPPDPPLRKTKPTRPALR
ncbi:YihY/virulence factor BrkB family protein [Embleya sp. NBC_00896]|uniref:YihY/virulence factor BrkB family protein n=1 Tax=Embleya sp. NBC_00896 TaxID=2975961 RepID=UPI00386AA635|nr:YihY/virulence factor BrkB family protein [Embleya sp. NBC_00896]